MLRIEGNGDATKTVRPNWGPPIAEEFVFAIWIGAVLIKQIYVQLRFGSHGHILSTSQAIDFI